MIKSVTPLATAPGGWRIEFTGGSPSSIDILNGAQGTPGVTPRIEVRTGADGTISVWYNVGGGWTDTGVNIRGPQGDPGTPGTPGTPGVSPRVRVVDNGDGTVTIQYNATAGYRNYFTGGAFQQGVDGYYWSSEAAGSSTGYDLYFHSSGVNPLTNYHDYNYSLSVRCVRQ